MTENKFKAALPTFFSLAVFLLLAAYALNANPFAGETVAPFDRLLQLPGWSSIPSDRKAVCEERSDILDSQLPVWITLKKQIRSAESPLWYPNGAGGQPICFELLNPIFWVFVLIKDNALAYYLGGLLKLAIAGFGTFLLLRTFLRPLPSIWGGIVFMLCGFNAAWFFWDHVATAMWIPWLLWATVMYLRSGRAKWLPAVTVMSVLLIWGGFFAVAGFGFYSFGLLLLVWNARSLRLPERRTLLLRQFLLPLVAVGIAFLISSVALLPFIDSMSSVNLSYRLTGGSEYSVDELWRLFIFKAPTAVEEAAYVGVLPCLLAVIGVVAAFKARDRASFTVGLFFVVLLLASGSIAFSFAPHSVVSLLPIFKNNPQWGRVVLVTLLSCAALSAIGLEWSLQALERWKVASGKIPMVPVNALLVAVAVVLCAIQFHCQKQVFNSYNAVVPGRWFYPETPSISYVKERLLPLQSVIADDSFLVSGTLGAYGIREWYGHSFRTDKEKEALTALTPGAARTATAMVVSEENIRYESPLMDKLGVKYLLIDKLFPQESFQQITRSLQSGKWHVFDLENGVLVVENTAVTNGVYAIPRLDLDAAADFSAATLLHVSPDTIVVGYQKEEPGWVVLPMHLDAGWKAYRNGQPLQYDHYLDIMPAIPVNAPCKLVFRYEPQSVHKGLLGSALGACIFLVFAGFCLKKKGSAAPH